MQRALEDMARGLPPMEIALRSADAGRMSISFG